MLFQFIRTVSPVIIILFLSISEAYASAGDVIKDFIGIQYPVGCCSPEPTAIAVSKDGTIYLNDSGRAKLIKLDKKGNVLAFQNSSSSPGTMSIDEDTGDIYQIANSRVYKIDKNLLTRTIVIGDGITFVGSNTLGGLSARFHLSPEGLAIDNGKIYTSDRGAQKIKVYDKNTFEYLDSFGGGTNDYGDGTDAKIWFARGIDIDSLGNIYVSVTGFKVKVYDSSFRFIRDIDFSDDTDFVTGAPIHIDSFDNLILFDLSNYVGVLRYPFGSDTPNLTIGRNQNFGMYSEISSDANGDFYVTWKSPTLGNVPVAYKSLKKYDGGYSKPLNHGRIIYKEVLSNEIGVSNTESLEHERENEILSGYRVRMEKRIKTLSSSINGYMFNVYDKIAPKRISVEP